MEFLVIFLVTMLVWLVSVELGARLTADDGSEPPPLPPEPSDEETPPRVA